MPSSEGGRCRARGPGLAASSQSGVALALALLLLAPRRRRRASTRWPSAAGTSAPTPPGPIQHGGAKFRPDSYCATPPGADPFDGAHLKSFTREDQGTVSGTRYARWRWDAPPGTGITRVSGTWWHALHDGIEQRVGVANWNGGFDAFAGAATTDTTPREFVAGFSPAQPALEDRLLCARAESKWCSLEPGIVVGGACPDDHRRGRLRRRHRRSVATCWPVAGCAAIASSATSSRTSVRG